ncbi:pyridoxamine 5'-phosphate oxidase family protein [Streptomyces sp. NBC_01476]|uniref:pyridoxamine 5'-phosphate oxidase family protein n=1 Tax=Streptomyces sp. NBC_01476 TaxID=2903881 RepID=UPI002E30FA27|nr:pyridoxamine 5'-phosphate oxidase family protein [Streptomyces sp. NBC_01476]
MNDHAPQRSDPATVIRRVRERRKQLGMSENALATEAGMAPPYLRRLLESDTDFDPGGLVRVAAALGLTYEELLRGRSDPPPGQTGAAPRPVLIRLAESECWDRLGAHGVGRVAIPVRPGPAVLPVNYAVDAGTIVYRTAAQGAAAPDTGTAVSFQVDRIDDRLSQGWSVLVTGTAERISDPDTAGRLAAEHDVEPWAGGDRPLWMRIRPDGITGRRIGTM